MTTREAVLEALREVGRRGGERGGAGVIPRRQQGGGRQARQRPAREGYAIEARPGRGYTLRIGSRCPTSARGGAAAPSGVLVAICRAAGRPDRPTTTPARSLALEPEKAPWCWRLGRPRAADGSDAPGSRPTEARTSRRCSGRRFRRRRSPRSRSRWRSESPRGSSRSGCDPSVKWPNDVLVDDGKVAGVLLEMAAEADRVDWVVVGVGVNVRRPSCGVGRFEAPRTCATSIDASVPEVVAALLDGIASAYGRWLDGGFEPLRAGYESRLTLAGSPVRVSSLDGVRDRRGNRARRRRPGPSAGRVGAGRRGRHGRRGHSARLTRRLAPRTVNHSRSCEVNGGPLSRFEPSPDSPATPQVGR